MEISAGVTQQRGDVLQALRVAQPQATAVVLDRPEVAFVAEDRIRRGRRRGRGRQRCGRSRGLGGSLGERAVPVDRIYTVRARETLERELAHGAERERLSAVEQLVQERGNQDLAAARLRRDARRQDDRLAEEAVALADRLAGVQPHAYADGVLGVLGAVAGELVLDLHGAREAA